MKFWVEIPKRRRPGKDIISMDYAINWRCDDIKNKGMFYADVNGFGFEKRIIRENTTF